MTKSLHQGHEAVIIAASASGKERIRFFEGFISPSISPRDVGPGPGRPRPFRLRGSVRRTPLAPLAEHGILTKVGLGVLLYAGAMLACQLLFWLVVTPFVIMASKKYRFWVTNRRVVTRSGIVGYKISSIPLERIADVTVSRNVIAMIARTPLVVIRDMAANSNWRGPRWIGVDDAEQVQHDILEATAEVNRAGRAV